MKLFGVNSLLALIWLSLSGSFTLSSLMLGYGLGFFTIWLAQPLFEGSNSYLLKSLKVMRLIAFFLYDLFVSSIRVAKDVLTRTDYSKPAILHMPLDVKTDLEIYLVTNLISLTPGSLSVDVTPDRSTLIIHAMYAEDPDAMIAELKSGIERLVKEVFDHEH